jgi:hypothetical protein
MSLSVSNDPHSASAPETTPEEIAWVESLIDRFCHDEDEDAFSQIVQACRALLSISAGASDALLSSDFLSRLANLALNSEHLSEVFDCLSALIGLNSVFESSIVHLNLPSILIEYLLQWRLPPISDEEAPITASAFRLFAKLLEASNPQLRRQCWMVRARMVGAIIGATRAFSIPLACIVEPAFRALSSILRQDSPPLTSIQGFLDCLLLLDLEVDVALQTFRFFRVMLESMRQTNFYASKARVARILEWFSHSEGDLRSAIVRVIEYLTYCSEPTSAILIEHGVVPAVVEVLREGIAVASCLHVLANLVVRNCQEVCECGVFEILLPIMTAGSMAEMVGCAFLLGNAMVAGAARQWPEIAFLMTMLESAEGQLACAILEGFARMLSDGDSSELREALMQPEVGDRMTELSGLTAETGHAVSELHALIGMEIH